MTEPKQETNPMLVFQAVRYHIPMAKKMGASRGEVRDAILLTLPAVGLRGIASTSPEALRAYNEAR